MMIECRIHNFTIKYMELLDYRNGKYQGGLSGQLRQGVGIFIDDDLAFHLSHWKHGQLDGPTLLYLSHGKYLYGVWKNDLPHGLNVFRCADTVLVGSFKDGEPTGRCLVVFQRFNLACILQEGEFEWRVATSGQLQNHNSLLKYVQQLGVVVPDHCFSLTKFVSSFSNADPRLKTFPTHGHHCYFGFLNGLALVFNPTNALLSVGYHRNEQLAEFGARFQGSRSAEEGNFENGGERIRYIGERPSAKIYSIFQKLHKQSLNFKNQYFESRKKVFLAVEELVRGKLSEIGQNCRRNHLGLVDLNDSLDFQDYDEQESLKINSIRQQVYSPPDNTKFFRKQEKVNQDRSNSTLPTPSNSTNSKNPSTVNTPKNSIPVINTGLSRLKDTQPKSPTVRKNQQNVFSSKKSPIRSEKKEVFSSNNKKSAFSNQPPTPKQTYNLKQIEQEIGSESHREATKLKQKMKSNNLRYINDYLSKQSKESVKDEKRSTSNIKSNNIYKDNVRKNEDEVIRDSIKTQPVQDYEYRVPTFKGLAQEIQNNKKKRKQAYLEPQQRRANPLERLERQERIDRTPDKFNKQAPDVCMPKKTTDVNNLSRPKYEDIQDRRQRIIREFKDLNKSSQKQAPAKPTESPNTNVFSIPYQEQGSFGYLPLTISNNNKPQNEKMKESRNPPSFAKKENIPAPEVRSSIGSNPYTSSAQRNYPYEGNPYTAQNEQSSPPRKKLNIYVPADVNDNGQGGTPYRQKRNYQYLYD